MQIKKQVFVIIYKLKESLFASLFDSSFLKHYFISLHSRSVICSKYTKHYSFVWVPSYIGMSSFRQHLLDKIHCYQGKQSENGFRKDKKLTVLNEKLGEKIAGRWRFFKSYRLPKGRHFRPKTKDLDGNQKYFACLMSLQNNAFSRLLALRNIAWILFCSH